VDHSGLGEVSRAIQPALVLCATISHKTFRRDRTQVCLRTGPYTVTVKLKELKKNQAGLYFSYETQGTVNVYLAPYISRIENQSLDIWITELISAFENRVDSIQITN
jgi:hypothetical protein